VFLWYVLGMHHIPEDSVPARASGTRPSASGTAFKSRALLPPVQRLSIVVLILCLSVLGAGCSLAFTSAPDTRPGEAGRTERFEEQCTASVLAPILDTVVAGPFAILTVGGVACMAGECGGAFAEIVAIVGAVAAGLSYSAWRGYRNTANCRDAKRRKVFSAPTNQADALRDACFSSLGSDACYALAQLHATGAPGVEQDPEKTAKLLGMACYLGHPLACLRAAP
jgi:hypothetical protein